MQSGCPANIYDESDSHTTLSENLIPYSSNTLFTLGKSLELTLFPKKI